MHCEAGMSIECPQFSFFPGQTSLHSQSYWHAQFYSTLDIPYFFILVMDKFHHYTCNKFL